jgi:YkoY family integral membrane protein
MFFDQTFALQDLAVVALLIVLEGVLSIDNALVLGLLAKRLPKREQPRALTYGLIGAFAFRFISIATAQLLLRFRIVKLVGGLYLFYVAAKYFWEAWCERGEESRESDSLLGADEVRKAGFWATVLVIELTDIAFAVDSILAAIALVGSAPEGHTGWHPKLWVVVTGGMLGVVLMRYAAVIFIKLLERFPRFETAAYLLVMVIGGKLVLDWQFNTAHEHKLDFHSPSSAAFWIFWLAMLASFSIGFIPKKNRQVVSKPDAADVPAPVDLSDAEFTETPDGERP